MMGTPIDFWTQIVSNRCQAAEANIFDVHCCNCLLSGVMRSAINPCTANNVSHEEHNNRQASKLNGEGTFGVLPLHNLVSTAQPNDGRVFVGPTVPVNKPRYGPVPVDRTLKGSMPKIEFRLWNVDPGVGRRG